ncbi:MAG: transglutaminase family protein [Chloroflexi bacterium]|nr:transglutaminase family protein [Chloroflexota bacterium]MDA1241033.1 transglutaminase family protein [Chloroflexota bacterium]
MIVNVRWETTYDYSEPVQGLHTEVCILPVSRTGGQQVVSASLTTEPDARPNEIHDVFGNTIHHIDFLRPVERLHVVVQAQVDTVPWTEPATPLSPLLDRVYRQPTPRTPFDSALDPFEADIPADAPPLEVAMALNRALREHLDFIVGSTEVSHTALDFIATGSGVCQDFAHLMLALLRRRGIPARYVSGYLAASEGDTFADASHAWVQVMADGAWYGFDPANAIPQDERYVIVAAGRDYDDVPPLRGTYAGQAVEQWSTSVRIGATQ